MSAAALDTSPQYSPKALEIIQHANELLAAGGYNGFSYADIAERVNVRKASIHHHFPAKSDLVKAAVVLHRRATVQGLAELARRTPDAWERLVAYCGYWAQCIRRSSPPICICALLAAELPAIPDEVADEVKTHFRDLTAWVEATLEEGVREGSLQLSGSPAAEAANFIASVHGAMLAARAAGDPAVFWQITQLATQRLKA